MLQPSIRSIRIKVKRQPSTRKVRIVDCSNTVAAHQGAFGSEVAQGCGHIQKAFGSEVTRMLTPHTPMGFLSSLDRFLKIMSKLGPSKFFNILKAPEQCMVLFRVMESPIGVTIFMTLWAILAFWISTWGPRFFWSSIALQLLFIGIPLCIWLQHGASAGEFLATVIRPNMAWPLWAFLAGLVLEVMEQLRNRQ